MAKKKKLITCIFCGDIDVERSEEDVIPHWLADKMAHYCRLALGDENAKPAYTNFIYESPDQLVADQKAGTIGANASTRTVVGETPVAYKLLEVCKKCNGGWMEHLEHIVKLRLIPGLLEGKTKALDPFDQLTLSMWAMKACLAYDAVQTERGVPEELGCQLLYRNGYPLLYSVVLIAHYPEIKMDGEILHGRDLRYLERDVDCSALSISFRFGHFAIFTIINMPTARAIASGRIIELPSGPKDDPRFIQIWPPTGGRIEWPSDGARASASSSDSGVSQ